MDILTIDTELLKKHPLPDWNEDGDRKTRGKLLLIGGSRRIPGATILAARAAFRAGCGGVRVAAPSSITLALGIAIPELMVVPLGETEDGTIAESAGELIVAQSKICQSIVLGPGLDENAETDAVAREIVTMAPLPLVVDAQAISALGAKFSWKKTKAPRVLTPHLGEFEALSGQSLTDLDEAARAEVVSKWSQANGAVVVLKGRQSLVASPDGQVYKNEGKSRAIETAGAGDVLAGIIGGLLAQGIDATSAAIWGVYLHAEAGEAVTKDSGADGVMARDFIDRLPDVQKFVRRTTEVRDRKSFGLRPL